jgi:uncharacterized protein YdeI (YjbR/CyaY-like superfamily)
MEMLEPADAAEWETWLREHHDHHGGIWLKVAKKGSRHTSVTIAEALQVALCYGWIDSQRRGLDGDHFLQRYSPRRAGSRWSQVNIGHVEALVATGRMQPAGLAQVEAAQGDGRWAAAYQAQRTATVPADLTAALAADPRAAERFAALKRTERYLLIFGLETARTAKGRQARLDRTINELSSP